MLVGILGCGYVGLELGVQLRDAGHDVVGVRRSKDGVRSIRDAGLAAVRADVTDAATLEAIPDVDVLVFAVSAGSRTAEAARRVSIAGLRTVVDHFSGRNDPPNRLVYTSSTGVYGHQGGRWVDENTPIEPATERQAALLEAERVALEESRACGIDGTVIRFAGLYGPNRYRVNRYLDMPVPDGYLNLLHRDDAASVVAFLLEQEQAVHDVVLAVDDEPVQRHVLARWLADHCGSEAPELVARSDADRQVSSRRCSNELLRSSGYQFTHPTFRDGYADRIAACKES